MSYQNVANTLLRSQKAAVIFSVAGLVLLSGAAIALGMHAPVVSHCLLLASMPCSMFVAGYLTLAEAKPGEQPEPTQRIAVIIHLPVGAFVMLSSYHGWNLILAGTLVGVSCVAGLVEPAIDWFFRDDELRHRDAKFS